MGNHRTCVTENVCLLFRRRSRLIAGLSRDSEIEVGVRLVFDKQLRSRYAMYDVCTDDIHHLNNSYTRISIKKVTWQPPRPCGKMLLLSFFC